MVGFFMEWMERFSCFIAYRRGIKVRIWEAVIALGIMMLIVAFFIYRMACGGGT